MVLHRWRHLAAIALLVGLSVGPSPGARACTVCIPVPQETAADLLIKSDTVVLAREDPDRPFFYHAIETLKGVYNGARIDLFVDSATRRMLAASPEQGVVLAHDARNGWRSLGYADPDYDQVVRHVIGHAPHWSEAERIEFFAGFLGHENRKVADLAYLEVGRAPYQMIKGLSSHVTPDQIRSFLRDITYYEWRALYILMLAQSENQEDLDYIRKSFDSAEKHHIDNDLAAWATAYIEIDGEQAVRSIVDRFFRSRDRSAQELIEIINALSVHGSDGHVHLRDIIVGGYEVLLETHPTMAGYVAKDLAAWREWRLAEPIKGIANGPHNLDAAALFAIGYYLGQAADQSS